MLDIDVNSPAVIRTAGMQVLSESLGPVGFARFIQQFEIGYGDYTKEKELVAEPSFDEIDKELQAYL